MARKASGCTTAQVAAQAMREGVSAERAAWRSAAASPFQHDAEALALSMRAPGIASRRCFGAWIAAVRRRLRALRTALRCWLWLRRWIAERTSPRPARVFAELMYRRIAGGFAEGDVLIYDKKPEKGLVRKVRR